MKMLILVLVLALARGAWADVTAVNNSNGTWTVTAPPEDRAVIEAAEQTRNPKIIEEVLNGWLRGERQFFDHSRKDQTCDRYRKLPQATRDAVDKQLGGPVC